MVCVYAVGKGCLWGRGGGVCVWEGVCVCLGGCMCVWEGVCVSVCMSVCVWLGGDVWVQVFPKAEGKD